MVTRIIEWAEFTLVSILLVRFIAMVTNNDDSSLWEKTERKAKKALDVIASAAHVTKGEKDRA